MVYSPLAIAQLSCHHWLLPGCLVTSGYCLMVLSPRTNVRLNCSDVEPLPDDLVATSHRLVVFPGAVARSPLVASCDWVALS